MKKPRELHVTFGSKQFLRSGLRRSSLQIRQAVEVGIRKMAKGGNMKLGDLVRDTISGFEGVVVARTDWLNGCVRLTLQSKKMHEGKPIDNQTFDIQQLELRKPAKPKEARDKGGERQNVVRASDPR